jgi:hypothetical protein
MGKRKDGRRRARKLQQALESNRRIVGHGKAAADAVEVSGALRSDDVDQAIRERAMGLLYASALMIWTWSPPGVASEQFATLAEQAFAMAGQTLLAQAPRDPGDDEVGDE